jgi:uncharacterized protein (DUF736 family)
MTPSSALAAAPAVAISPLASPPDIARCIGTAAQLLLRHLEQGRQVDAAILRSAMAQAFGGSDASGAWDWKTAYDACEAATVLFLRKYGKALLRKAGSPALTLAMLEKIVGLLPTHTRRSTESEALQQFSTPIPLGLAVATAAAVTPADRVLEPSAGTGLLAILAEIAGGVLVLNELAETRAGVLSLLFPTITTTRHDAAQIHDHLDAAIVPSVVIMNPPFSAMANVHGRMPSSAALRPARRCGVDRLRPTDRHRGRNGAGSKQRSRRTTMATIGTFKKSGNEFVGQIVTLSVQAKNVRIVPEANRSGENAPSHRVFAGRVEIGAAWAKRSNEGRDYLGLKLDDPSFTAPIYANLFDDEEGEGYSLIWSRPNRRNGE